MILLNDNSDQQVESIKTDPSRNDIILNLTMQGEKATLVHIYGPNEDDTQFSRYLEDKNTQN